MLSERLRTEHLFGVPFTAGTLSDIRDHLLAELASRRRRLVITANTDHLVRLRRHPDLLKAYLAADLVLADGMPVVWGARVVGAPLPERVTGVDLMNELFRSFSSLGRSVYLLGSTDEVLAAGSEALADRYPGIRLAGTHHGFFSPDEDDDVVAGVNASGADALFVGMGSPRQERWAAAHARSLEPRLVVCVGGSLEVLAGVRSRAPRWMQRSGLEWSYRLFQEPGRLWKRYLVDDAAFLPILAREWRRRARRERRTPSGWRDAA
jgi:N-acetylglucosaminyldiphosphoundecaprenol N-acetyl-beta-D-mannosaminyltransferase